MQKSKRETDVIVISDVKSAKRGPELRIFLFVRVSIRIELLGLFVLAVGQVSVSDCACAVVLEDTVLESGHRVQQPERSLVPLHMTGVWLARF